METVHQFLDNGLCTMLETQLSLCLDPCLILDTVSELADKLAAYFTHSGRISQALPSDFLYIYIKINYITYTNIMFFFGHGTIYIKKM